MKTNIFFFSLANFFVLLFFSIDVHSAALHKNHENKLNLILSFYNNDAPIRFIVVEKSKQKLMVFEQQHSLKLLKTFVCATGENPGNKNIRGDLKTPEGLYFITEMYHDKNVTVFGKRAYHLDYPNVFDRQSGHRGDGIFIHGTNKSLTPNSTHGCIALANEDLDELATYLTINTIPIVVLENLPGSLLQTDLQISKNDSRFKKILDNLSVSKENFSTDNIESFFFLTFGSQAIASINYKVYDGNSIVYRYLKRVYLVPAVSKEWRILYSVESQTVLPTLLATHPIKNPVMAQTAPPQMVD